MPLLLIVHHTPSPAVRELLEAVLTGAGLPELNGLDLCTEPALSATASDLLDADAIVLLTPANIGYMSGALKHFFDNVYYPCLDARRGLPFGLIVHGNDDTTGAVRSVTKIAAAMGWKQAAAVVEVTRASQRADVAAAQELGSVLGLAALTAG